MLALGLSELSRYSSEQSRYERLAQDVSPDKRGEQAPDTSPEVPPGATAWVEVSGTGINLPVADGSRGASWYLTHDLWGNKSALGCPFIDSRCSSPYGPHVIVYGHHLAFTNYMFSPLHRCYQQRQFSRLGSCLWTTVKGSCILEPLCALSVDSSWPDILRFSFSSDEEFHAWLDAIIEASTARAPNARELSSGASRVITLVTCSSNRAGQPWRTLVLFAC